MSDRRLIRPLWTFLRPDRWTFAGALVVTPVAALLALAQPYLMKKAIDEHVVPGAWEGLLAVAGTYLAAVVAGYVVEAGYVLALAWAGQRTVVRIRTTLYRHLLGLSQRYLDRQPAGRLLTRVTSDVDTLGEAFSSGLITIVLDLLMIVGTLAAMLWLDARLTLMLVLLAPLLLVPLEVVRRRLRALFHEVRAALSAVNTFLSERIDGVEVVQLFRHESAAEAQFDQRNDRFRSATTRSNVYDSLMYALVDGASSICIAAMLFYGAGALGLLGAGRPFSGEVTAGLLVAFIEYLDRLFRPLRELSGKIAVLQRGSASLAKIVDLLEVQETAPVGGEVVERLDGHLVLRDVRFRYRSDGEDVLRGVDLEVRPGEVVAVVGATGAGKTSLTRLLDTSYGGYRGSITLDGRELRDLDPASVRRRLAGVRQDIQLFTETVRFNVDLGNDDIPLHRCREAAELVHADRVTGRIGWDHELRERGADLSVGEGQLLVLARAMAHDPDVIILDEATASVDTLTEKLIQDALARIFERKTVIVIAHRLSTVRSADRIVVMDQGRVVEQGTHDELLEEGGAYAALVRAGEGLLVA